MKEKFAIERVPCVFYAVGSHVFAGVSGAEEPHGFFWRKNRAGRRAQLAGLGLKAVEAKQALNPR